MSAQLVVCGTPARNYVTGDNDDINACERRIGERGLHLAAFFRADHCCLVVDLVQGILTSGRLFPREWVTPS